MATNSFDDGVQDRIPPRRAGQATPEPLPVISPTDGVIRPARAGGSVTRGAGHHGGTGGSATSGQGKPAVAVLGDLHRSGRWTVPSTFTAYALLADVNLDLREAELPDGDVTIEVMSCLGDVRIVVPPGMRVQTEGTTILGDTKIDVAADPTYDGPTVTVRRTTVLGDVKVRSFAPGETPPKRWRWF